LGKIPYTYLFDAYGRRLPGDNILTKEMLLDFRKTFFDVNYLQENLTVYRIIQLNNA